MQPCERCEAVALVEVGFHSTLAPESHGTSRGRNGNNNNNNHGAGQRLVSIIS